MRFNGESVQLFGRSLDRAAFTALMGMMECRWWGLMLKCFALGLWQYPWGLSFWGCFLSLIDIFMPWMLSAVSALNFGACFGLLLWLCLLCFGWVGLCLGWALLWLCGLCFGLGGLCLGWGLLCLGWGFALPWVGCWVLGVFGVGCLGCWVLGVLGVWGGVGCRSGCPLWLGSSPLGRASVGRPSGVRASLGFGYQGIASARSGCGRGRVGCSGFARLRG